jgi:hypothetical protein
MQNTDKTFRIPWETAPALFLTLAVVFCSIFLALQRTDNVYVYPMDDPYIHMAISRNLAANGTWGVIKGTFTYSTSSILYPLLLALNIFFFGPEETIPLILNIITGILLILVLAHIFKKIGIKRWISSVFLVVMALLIPLPVMIFICMEHVLQILTVVPLVWYAACFISKTPDNLHVSNAHFLYLFGFLAASVRFEALFTTAVICLILLFTRRYTETLILAISSFLPMAMMGVISIYNGSRFLPNPLIIKGRSTELSFEDILKWFSELRYVFYHNSDFMIMIIVSILFTLMFYYLKRCVMHVAVLLNWIVVGSIIMHFLFGKVGWYIRYEAYLYTLFLLSCCISYQFIIREYWAGFSWSIRSAFAVLLILAVIPMAVHSYKGIAAGPQASENIYQQAWQVGQFVKTHYSGKTIVCHDIGTITFYTDLQIFDLLGLGDREAMDRTVWKPYRSSAIRDIARRRGAEIAICYKRWFDLPKEWIEVGEWSIQGKAVTSGEPVISFFAITAENTDRLIYNLENWNLPEGCVSSVLRVENRVTDESDEKQGIP